MQPEEQRSPGPGVSRVEVNCAYKYSTRSSGDLSSFDKEAIFFRMFTWAPVCLCARCEMDVRQQCVSLLGTP